MENILQPPGGLITSAYIEKNFQKLVIGVEGVRRKDMFLILTFFLEIVLIKVYPFNI